MPDTRTARQNQILELLSARQRVTTLELARELAARNEDQPLAAG